MASAKSPVTCHVLDSTLGKPAANVNVRLEVIDGSSFMTLASGQTDSDGRCVNLLPPQPRLKAGIYRMIFNTGEYFEKDKRDTFYPIVEVSHSILPNQTNTITFLCFLALGRILLTVVVKVPVPLVMIHSMALFVIIALRD
ncbi:Transthyretin domain-containing protein [Rhizoctonia solani AG-1 IA]|uniref:5-hydroxyisourate hydrolase n=1 Tax=Thanatephorus cucumeris (strain AG1-IA) TaxID=983506 RepID=L8WPF8_THACA|nr:Transthyretin domain-containing protein [Rhizoctonia solani AG-1 IA]